METTIEPAEVILAEELRKDPESFEGKCVRVLGKVAAINPRDNTAELTGGGVVVDLKLVGAVKAGSLYQFIGDVATQSADDGVVVNARLGWCVDGVDVRLYKEALRARRQFLKTMDA
eukprot:m.61597 g.61597  ORF g.61597 m.61597 type:complete len:117 (-) comp17586_c0_seq1:1064-1414(-)